MFSTSITRKAELNAYFNGNPPESPERTVAQHLLPVSTTFVQAQQRRIDADYNMGKEVTETETLAQIKSVSKAFKSWNIIRNEATAQDYLLSMLGNKDRRERKADPPKQPKRRGSKRQPGITFRPPDAG
jgi:hypothetical protein